MISIKVLGQKSDTLIHINGNILTGEFKSLVYGVISYSMQGMNTISIDEVDISSIKSKKQCEIKLTNDSIYYGTFDTCHQKRKAYIILSDSTRKLIHMNEIVEVYPIKKNFWQRTSGDFSLGLNLAKSNKNISLVTSGDLSHRKKKTFFELQWNNNLTWYMDTLNSSSNQVALSYQRYIKKKWSTGSGIGYDQNSELGVKSRFGISALIIRDFVYNSWNRLYTSGGFSATQEWDYGVDGSSSYIAGELALGWKVYRYKEPKINVDTYIVYFPYINVKRHRVNINIAPNISVFGDNFKFGFSFNYIYDSSPPSEQYSTFDYTLSATMTYSFH